MVGAGVPVAIVGVAVAALAAVPLPEDFAEAEPLGFADAEPLAATLAFGAALETAAEADALAADAAADTDADGAPVGCPAGCWATAMAATPNVNVTAPSHCMTLFTAYLGALEANASPSRRGIPAAMQHSRSPEGAVNMNG